MKIELNDVKNWIGSNNLNSDYLLSLLTELINNEYSVEDFKNDVLDLMENTK